MASKIYVSNILDITVSRSNKEFNIHVPTEAVRVYLKQIFKT